MITNQQDPVSLAKQASIALCGAAGFMGTMMGPYLMGLMRLIADMGLPQPWRAAVVIAAFLGAVAAPSLFGFAGIRLLKKSQALSRM